MSATRGFPRTLSRRSFLVASAGAGLGLVACGREDASPVLADDPAVRRAEDERRRRRAPTRSFDLTARPVEVDLAGRVVRTWAYGSGLAAAAIRLTTGEVLEARLTNDLPDPTTIHWHGLALRNDMDGVERLTQRRVDPGDSFAYRFTVPDPGTYFFHPHTGTQLDRGLYGSLIVDDPDDGVDADVEHVVLLDDWVDGVDGRTPDDELRRLRSSGMDMGASGMARSRLLGGDAGDVRYPLHLVNGRPPADRPTLEAPAGGRVRLRIINAGSDTAYRVAVGGHRLTVTHTDGFPVRPVEVDALLLGMGERYDVAVQLRSGAWPLVALAEGKDDAAVAVLRSTDSQATTAPPPAARPTELDGRLLRYDDLRPGSAVALESHTPHRRHHLDLDGSMGDYRWSFDGTPFAEHEPVEVRQGERVQLEFTNRSAMWHPVHLHGHTFALGGGDGPRKDTFNLLPSETVAVEFDAENPGQWMVHCHNTYHLESGMAAVLSYVA